MTVTSNRPARGAERAAAVARQHHHRYVRHIGDCVECVGALCWVGRRLEIDADAAGWRAENARWDG